LIVLDSSAAMELLIRREHAEWVDSQILADPRVHAPQLLDLEVANGLRRFVLRGLLEERCARLALYDLSMMRIQRHGHQLFLARVWQLRTHVTAYDAAYVALAEELGARLVTTDFRLAGAHGLRTAVATPPA
jgi:predicted nucleic acid-binding protein